MDIRDELKRAIIEGLNLEDLTPEQIDNDAPLFGEGSPGLDSLDAVELVVIVQRHYGVDIADMSQGREAFASVNALAKFIRERSKA